MENKETVRNLIRRRRSSMKTAEVVEKSEAICRRLEQNSMVRQADMILVYSAIHNEADLRFFVEQCWKMGKTVAFPKCEGEQMEFYPVSSWEELAEGSFHILEPIDTKCAVIPGNMTVVCVPGIAFSDLGDRIGMGKGYYDRYLSRYPELYKIGLGYELQTEYRWTPDVSDIAMDLLITEIREVQINECKGIM